MSAPEMKPQCALRAGRLAVEVYPARAEMGRAAAGRVADCLRRLLARQGAARMIFACAPSQDEFLAALAAEPGVAWDRVTVFHMDEYAGLPAAHPASFRHYLKTHLLDRVPVGRFHGLEAEAGDCAEACRRYADLLAAAPIDGVCLGIGENGHIAFNDPPVADFFDPCLVKRVALESACRRQQVNDGCFPALAAVPREAVTLTIPALLSARRLFCIVPGARKAAAVRAAVEGPIGTDCPASILRRHPDAVLFLDAEAAAGLAEPACAASFPR